MKHLRAACSALAIVGLSIPAMAQTRADQHEMHQRHRDTKPYIASLEDPDRDAYQKPHEVLMALGLAGNERVADVGAGSGYFATRFAEHLAKGGHVYQYFLVFERARPAK